MKSFSDVVKITEFFLNVAQWERHVEFTRQFLNGLDNFEPYSTFRHIAKGGGRLVEISDLRIYLEKNGNSFENVDVETVLRLYDTDSDHKLNYEEFLQIVLSKDNSDLRFLAANRQPFEFEENGLHPEIDMVLSNLVVKEIYFVDSFRRDPDLEDLFKKNDWFYEIDTKMTGFIDFDNLKEFFNRHNIYPLDEELIFILRRIDINDDGRIDKKEFMKFLDMVIEIDIQAQKKYSSKNGGYQDKNIDERNSQVNPNDKYQRSTKETIVETSSVERNQKDSRQQQLMSENNNNSSTFFKVSDNKDDRQKMADNDSRNYGSGYREEDGAAGKRRGPQMQQETHNNEIGEIKRISNIEVNRDTVYQNSDNINISEYGNSHQN